MNSNLSKTIILFVALAMAGIFLVIFGQGAEDSTVRTVLPLLGIGIFTAGLTYFLVKIG